MLCASFPSFSFQKQHRRHGSSVTSPQPDRIYNWCFALRPIVSLFTPAPETKKEMRVKKTEHTKPAENVVFALIALQTACYWLSLVLCLSFLVCLSTTPPFLYLQRGLRECKWVSVKGIFHPFCCDQDQSDLHHLLWLGISYHLEFLFVVYTWGMRKSMDFVVYLRNVFLMSKHWNLNSFFRHMRIMIGCLYCFYCFYCFYCIIMDFGTFFLR